MRTKFPIRHLTNGFVTYQYAHPLSSSIRSKHTITNKERANELHITKNYDCYTVSSLKIDDITSTDDVYGLKFKTAYFVISSLYTDIIKDITEGFSINPFFNLGNEKFVVLLPENLKTKRIKPPCTLKTISSISINIEIPAKNGKLKSWALYPDDPRWNEQVTKNVIRRFTSYHNRPPTDTRFDITNVRYIKPHRITIGSGDRINYRRCSSTTFDVDGSEELINFAYEMGIGEALSIGFGCVIQW